MSSSTPRSNNLQHHSSSPSSSKEEIDLLKRLSELSIKGKHIKSGELLKLLRQLTLFDKDEIEVEFLVSVVEKTFVPLLKSLIGKDSDELRNNILSEAHKLKIFLRPSWILLNRLPMYKEAYSGDLTEANYQSMRLINLPSSPQLLKNINGF